jgi:hypothetical protein
MAQQEQIGEGCAGEQPGCLRELEATGLSPMAPSSLSRQGGIHLMDPNLAVGKLFTKTPEKIGVKSVNTLTTHMQTLESIRIMPKPTMVASVIRHLDWQETTCSTRQQVA